MAGEGRWSIAVDTGGTFTDACAVDPRGCEHRIKLLSSGRLRAQIVEVNRLDDGEIALVLDREFGLTRDCLAGFNFEIGTDRGTVATWSSQRRSLTLKECSFSVGEGTNIDLLSGEEVPVLAARLLTQTPLSEPLPPVDLRLATTRGTNALLEGKGWPPLVLLTRGFGDLLEIGDQRRPDLFALEHQKRRLPIAKVIEIDGRMSATGEELEPLDLDAVAEQLGTIPSDQRKTACVALLNSYRNPAHEEALSSLLRNSAFQHVSVSSELSPAIRILPRAQTTVADAYLAPVMNRFVEAVQQGTPGSLLLMTSAGGLEPVSGFRAKDSLLSGPAGGLVGALDAARSARVGDVITFDMGGTSTDVARIGDERLPYRFEQRIGDATVLAPALHIETVAAGGGSICSLKAEGLCVGPESAGADPGPACYGRGGPLTVTDLNLLLERLHPEEASIPLDAKAAQRALDQLKGQMAAAGLPVPEQDELLTGLLQIAIERMAEAIRKISLREGYDPSRHTLVAFGGAGPQHACAVADALGMTKVLIPADAGLLSARGVAVAQIERFAEEVVLAKLDIILSEIDTRLDVLGKQALGALGHPGAVRRQIAQVRLSGQEETIDIEVGRPSDLASQFASRFESLFGYRPPADRPLELVALRVSASTDCRETASLRFGEPEAITSPLTESTRFFTLVASPGWTLRRSANGCVLLQRSLTTPEKVTGAHTALALDLTRHRLTAAVEEMGAVLKRCAISTNVREREDFSCALLDADGQLAINAPHIPVHLGALGLCVRRVAEEIALGPGDIAVTNHPAFGGSHLPDVTVVCAVFDQRGQRIAYLANRAHHAEIGGITPGSMPPAARNLEEEGVVIAPRYLFEGGEPSFEQIAEILTSSRYPTRNLADNLADLHAQTAALRSTRDTVEALDPSLLAATLESLLRRSAQLSAEQITNLPFDERRAVQRLDNGAEIHVLLLRTPDQRLRIDFTGTSPTLAENLNATPAIVRSAILYALRLLLNEDLPLNEGLLSPVDIVLPECLLNPGFVADPIQCPPVVGGNVETSQRLVDTLLEALSLQAGSQGTMNNLLFGNDRFGYYETIAGGAGAGDGYPGADALHTHMTNTAITDPEVLEWRYPVRLRQFSIRRGSGGTGRYTGGDGVVREFEFLEPMTLSILAEHRIERPYGLAGGGDALPGRQSWTAPDGSIEELSGRFSGELPAGSRVRIETPGGGGFGKA